MRKGQGQRLLWKLVVFGPSDEAASLIDMILSLTLLLGPGILPETTVSKHNPPCHLQMPTKALSCKTEAISDHGPEAPLCPVGQGSFKMDCLEKWKSVQWSDEFKCDILVGNQGHHVLRAKDEGDLPACNQRSVQKPASLMVWGWICA